MAQTAPRFRRPHNPAPAHHRAPAYMCPHGGGGDTMVHKTLPRLNTDTLMGHMHVALHWLDSPQHEHHEGDQ